MYVDGSGPPGSHLSHCGENNAFNSPPPPHPPAALRAVPPSTWEVAARLKGRNGRGRVASRRWPSCSGQRTTQAHSREGTALLGWPLKKPAAPTPAALLCWLNSPTITPIDGASSWMKVGTGVLTQGSPQQPRAPCGRACSPTSGRPGSPPTAAGGLCSPQDGAGPVPPDTGYNEGIDARAACTMRERPA